MIFGPLPPEKNPAGRIELLTTSSDPDVRARFVDSVESPSAGRLNFDCDVEADVFSLVTDARCCLVNR
jgi:hypothetical protein